jgi:hypothetical protein
VNDKNNNLDNIDNFWDLESLLPQKRPVSARREINTETVEIEFGKPNEEKKSGAVIPPRPDNHNSTATQPSRVISPHEEARRLREIPLRVRAQQNEPKILEPYLIYEPNSNIIKRVAVSKWQTRYNFYEKFASDARRFWNRTATECDHVSFFSYIPQYNQLSYSQLKWYLYWREQVRNGVYLQTDYSYILLYIYEILNCPDLVEPKQGVELLCDIWIEYRTRYPRIDNYLCEWLCDYCLINQLPCPTHRLEPISQAIVAVASFKEFYMSAGTSENDIKIETASNILAYSSNYDWRSSRYVTKENIKIFSTHIQKAFDKIYHELLIKNDSGFFAKPASLQRDAYSGALCVYDMKRCLNIDYISYTRSPHFRFAVTDIIKYCENRVRMALGIKARLKVENLTAEMRACLDDYFDAELPIIRPQKSKSKNNETPQVNEYEKLYEPVSTKLSLENALNIEQKSWQTTEILTSALVDEENAAEQTSEELFGQAQIPDESTTADNSELTITSGDEFAMLISSLGETELKALRRLAQNDYSGIADVALQAGILADALADKINEAAFDAIGDSIVEPCNGGYKIISDYEGDILKCLH